MQFNLKVSQQEKPDPSTALSVSVSSETKREIQAIKKSSEENRRLVNYLARQFFEQLVEKFGHDLKQGKSA